MQSKSEPFENERRSDQKTHSEKILNLNNTQIISRIQLILFELILHAFYYNILTVF